MDLDIDLDVDLCADLLYTPKLNSLHHSGHKPDWKGTESNFPIKPTINLITEFDLLLIQLDLLLKYWKKMEFMKQYDILGSLHNQRWRVYTCYICMLES